MRDAFRNSRWFSVGRPPEIAGTCIDFGSSRSLIGLYQAINYCRAMRIKLSLPASQNCFRFGAFLTSSLGKIAILLFTPEGTIPLKVDVVFENIQMRIGLDALLQHYLEPSLLKRSLNCTKQNWSIPFEAKHGNLYLCRKLCLFNSIFTRNELERFHRHMLHSSSGSFIIFSSGLILRTYRQIL